jgi:hypothetical protein
MVRYEVDANFPFTNKKFQKFQLKPTYNKMPPIINMSAITAAVLLGNSIAQEPKPTPETKKERLSRQEWDAIVRFPQIPPSLAPQNNLLTVPNEQTTAIVFAAIFLLGLLIFLVMKICETVTDRRKKRAELQRQRNMAIRMRDLDRAKERAIGRERGRGNKRPSESVRGMGSRDKLLGP